MVIFISRHDITNKKRVRAPSLEDVSESPPKEEDELYFNPNEESKLIPAISFEKTTS